MTYSSPRRDRQRRALSIVLLTALSPLPALVQADNRLEEEVIVTSSRVAMPLREVGTAVSVLLEDDIQQRGFLSLPELLRTQPAVASSNNGGLGKANTLRIRGEEGHRTLVLLDGIDISDTSGPQVSPRLEQLLSSGISRVEILRGPQGLMYGADAGGVINIESAAPGDGWGGQLQAEAGRYGSRQLGGSVGADLGSVDLSVNLTELSTDGFNSRDTDQLLSDDDGYNNRTVHARAGWEPTDALRVEGVVRRVDTDNEFDSCFDAAFAPTDRCSDRFQQDAWRLGARYATDRIEQRLALSESSTERDFLAEDAAFFATEGQLRRLTYLGRWRAAPALQLVYGIDREEESINDGSIDRSRDQTGVYAEYQGRFAEALTITAGARHDDNEDFGGFTSYRLSAAWVTDLNQGSLKFRGSWGSGFRAPSLYEISYNRGPFALPPASEQSLEEETSEGYDLGISYAGDDGRYLELNWFDQQVDNLIIFDSGYLQSAGESDSRGIELIGSLPLGERLTLTGNYTWNETTAPDGSPRPFRPEHLLNLGVAYLGLDGRLRLGANLRSSAEAVGTSGEALDDYSLVDINASIQLFAGLTAYARLENALDEQYQEIPTYRTARRAAYAGVRYEF